ncbi:hypothetical protein SLEP1_g27086 [Rubroshorea leprosula]|uniref:Uncharacterized protein n=1 Tax=Rubroshorea leprosula TaxID=152421 RepID=A0AAV5JUT9_9ROSI|nr:hypothetical protein SLEP1_g27086 [Rubroshorea leprosula]
MNLGDPGLVVVAEWLAFVVAMDPSVETVVPGGLVAAP